MQGVLEQIQGAGWRQCEQTGDKASIREEEVRAGAKAVTHACVI